MFPKESVESAQFSGLLCVSHGIRSPFVPNNVHVYVVLNCTLHTMRLSFALIIKHMIGNKYTVLTVYPGAFQAILDRNKDSWTETRF